jgi:hypothetical protein
VISDELITELIYTENSLEGFLLFREFLFEVADSFQDVVINTIKKIDCTLPYYFEIQSSQRTESWRSQTQKMKPDKAAKLNTLF